MNPRWVSRAATNPAVQDSMVATGLRGAQLGAMPIAQRIRQPPIGFRVLKLVTSDKLQLTAA